MIIINILIRTLLFIIITILGITILFDNKFMDENSSVEIIMIVFFICGIISQLISHYIIKSLESDDLITHDPPIRRYPKLEEHKVMNKNNLIELLEEIQFLRTYEDYEQWQIKVNNHLLNKEMTTEQHKQIISIGVKHLTIRLLMDINNKLEEV